MAAGFDLFISHFYCLWWSMAYWFFFLVMGEMGWVGFVEAPGKKKDRDTHPHTHLTGTLYIGGAASAAPPLFYFNKSFLSPPPLPPLLSPFFTSVRLVSGFYIIRVCVYIYMYRRERRKKKTGEREGGGRETTKKVLARAIRRAETG